MSEQTTTSNVPARVERVSESDRLDRREIAVGQSLGGIAFSNMAEVMSFAQLMAISDVAIPKHLRASPGACLAIIIQAIEWKMSPYAVANKSYVVNDRIGYESQLIHAVIEQRAPLIGRMRNRFTGEGDQRRCIVWAAVKGEKDPLEFQSAPFGQILPKNSPLWKSKPDLQLYYNASRDWARMYFPDVILGVYAEDELDRTSSVQVERLPGVTKAQQMADDVKRRLPQPIPQEAASTEPPAPKAADPGSSPPAERKAAVPPPAADPPQVDVVAAPAPVEQKPDDQPPAEEEGKRITEEEVLGQDWPIVLKFLVDQAQEHSGMEAAEATARIAKHKGLFVKGDRQLTMMGKRKLLDAIRDGRLLANGSLEPEAK